MQFQWLRAFVLFSVLAGALLAANAAPASEPAGERPLNVLFIAVDDLRPQLGCYGVEYMQTPNLDRLARSGVTFQHHCVQVPTCGASRLALLTGRYPRQALARSNGAFGLMPRRETEQPASLAQCFRRGGYTTVALGKISHGPGGRNEAGRVEMPFCWDDQWSTTGPWQTEWNAFFAYAGGVTRTRGQSIPFEAAETDDEGYPDAHLANEAIARLQQLKDKPFFLAVGFFKPHMPFSAPKKYWDLYDPSAIPRPENCQTPDDPAAPIQVNGSGEAMGNYGGYAARGSLTPDEERALRHGYCAAASYVDAQIGKVLDELERLGLAENTVVVVWGDHGFHLGEHNRWGKHTLSEYALRSTLLVRHPRGGAAGKTVEEIVATIDLYPTLAELCNVRPPDNLDGKSFAQLLGESSPTEERLAVSYYGNDRTLRTGRYRITQRQNARGEVTAVELYDYQNDPLETTNVAEKHAELVRELGEMFPKLEK